MRVFPNSRKWVGRRVRAETTCSLAPFCFAGTYFDDFPDIMYSRGGGKVQGKKRALQALGEERRLKYWLVGSRLCRTHDALKPQHKFRPKGQRGRVGTRRQVTRQQRDHRRDRRIPG